MGGVALGAGEDADFDELFGGAFDGFGIVGFASGFFYPFVEVVEVDDFGAAFGHFV